MRHFLPSKKKIANFKNILLDGGSYPTMPDFLQLRKNCKFPQCTYNDAFLASLPFTKFDREDNNQVFSDFTLGLCVTQ